MKRILIVSTLMLLPLCTWAQPEKPSVKPADCLIDVKGKRSVDGRCKFTLHNGQSPTTAILVKERKRERYFAYINCDAPKATAGRASWNEELSSFHADAPLREVCLIGACWVNCRMKIRA